MHCFANILEACSPLPDAFSKYQSHINTVEELHILATSQAHICGNVTKNNPLNELIKKKPYCSSDHDSYRCNFLPTSHNYCWKRRIRRRRNNIRRARRRFILGLIYSRTADFKSLSAVTTMPDHQSSKTCRRWDSFRYPRLLQYAGDRKSRLKIHL